MRKVLYILGQLGDNDVEWMIENGDRIQLTPNSVLIHEGKPLDGFYIVLDGLLIVTARATGDTVLNRLSTGEVVGEMSFVDARPPSATVKASNTALVLSIPRKLLQKKLESDPEFASRFYRSLAIFLSYKLRGMMGMMGYNDSPNADEEIEVEYDDPDELESNVLDNAYLAGLRFDRMLKRMIEG
jgi:CRP/FNR family transcriptional regulator, cyclic AMP receptor protein